MGVHTHEMNYNNSHFIIYYDFKIHRFSQGLVGTCFLSHRALTWVMWNLAVSCVVGGSGFQDTFSYRPGALGES